MSDGFFLVPEYLLMVLAYRNDIKIVISHVEIGYRLIPVNASVNNLEA